MLTPESVAHAATRTAEAGSSRIELRVETTALGQAFGVEMSGLFDYERQRGRLLIEMPILEGEVEVLLDGMLFFLRVPDGLPESPLPPGKRRLKLDLEALAGSAGVDLGALGGMQRQSPAQILDYVRAADGEPEEVGEEEIRGVPTTHYRSRIDVRKAFEQQLSASPEEQQETMRAMLEQTVAAAGETVPVDVWVDADGLLRRVTTEMSAPSTQEAPVLVSVSMDLFDFGVAVDIEHPPAAQVLDLGDMLGAELAKP